jgi:hypothetical protein
MIFALRPGALAALLNLKLTEAQFNTVAVWLLGFSFIAAYKCAPAVPGASDSEVPTGILPLLARAMISADTETQRA